MIDSQMFRSTRKADAVPVAETASQGFEAFALNFVAFGICISAALTMVLDVGPVATALLIAIAFFLLPGYAFVTHIRTITVSVGLALSICLSLAIVGGVAFLMASTGSWYPEEATLAILALVAVSLATKLVTASRSIAFRSAPDERDLSARFASTFTLLVPLIVGSGLWALAASTIDIENLPDNGLPPMIPAHGYLGLAILICGGTWATLRPLPSRIVVFAYIAAFVGCLYATIPALAEVPQYVWTYKHIGVAELINQAGGAQPEVDIYNRWPTAFAVAAMFAAATDVPVIDFAGWAEPMFTMMQTCVVVAIASVVTRSARLAGLAGLIFVASTWTGQTYFGAQAMAFTLALGVVLVALACLAGDWHLIRPLAAASAWLERNHLRSRDEKQVTSIAKPTAVLVLLLLDAVLVTTHQLTPYMLILQLGAITLIGTIRPLWVVIAMAAITVLFLIPNLDWVNENYGLLNSFNPAENVRVQPALNKERTWLYAKAGPLNAALLLSVAFTSAFILIRSGFAKRTLPLIGLMLAPAAALLGNSYGGEISLRVFMFGSPAIAVLVASGVGLMKPRRLQFPAGAAVLIAASFLFLCAITGDGAQHVVDRNDVAASKFFDRHAPEGSVLMLADPNFPARSEARYSRMASSPSGNGPTLLSEVEFTDRKLGPRDVDRTVDLIGSYSRESGFLVFSESQLDDARIYKLTPPGSLEALESAVARSAKFELWYANPSARIYRVVPEPTS